MTNSCFQCQSRSEDVYDQAVSLKGPGATRVLGLKLNWIEILPWEGGEKHWRHEFHDADRCVNRWDPQCFSSVAGQGRSSLHHFNAELRHCEIFKCSVCPHNSYSSSAIVPYEDELIGMKRKTLNTKLRRCASLESCRSMFFRVTGAWALFCKDDILYVLCSSYVVYT